MEEELNIVGTLAFTCVSAVVALRKNAMDQISLFPDWPTPTKLFPQDPPPKDPIGSPQIIFFSSCERGNLYLTEVFNIRPLSNKAFGVNMPMTWEVYKVVVLKSKKYPDQVILHVNLPPSNLRGTVTSYQSMAFLVDEGLGEDYVQKVIKLPYEVQDRDAKKEGL
jgi:hypothetical protein